MRTRQFFYTLLASAMLAATAGLITACTAIDDPVSNPTYEEEDVYEAPEDPLGDFMAYFTTTDSLGNTVLGGYGEALDEGDPTVLSIGVKSLEDAEDLFRMFVTDTLHLTSYVAGNLTYTPVSRDGKQQGEINFIAGADGCIARVTFSDDIPQDLVSEVRFIDKKLWPNNAESPYIVGHEYLLMTAEPISSKGEWHNFLVDMAKVTENINGGFLLLCIDNGDYGGSLTFFRYKYLFGSSKGKFIPLSYRHDGETWVQSSQSGYWTYGFWTTKVKGGGEIIRNTCNYDDNTPDYALPSLAQLQKIHNTFGDEGIKNVIDKEALDYWFWTDEYNKKGLTFNLYAWNFSTGKSNYWRAYTHLGLLSEMFFFYNKEKAYNALREPGEMTRWEKAIWLKNPGFGNHSWGF